MEIIKINNIPRKILVFTMANTSKPFANFLAKICVITTNDNTKIPNISNEKIPKVVVIITNQNVVPNVTANDLNLGEDNSILYRIDECN